MQREIIFRGKRVDNGKWVVGDLQHNRDCFGNISDSQIYYFDSKHGRCFYEEVIPTTVGRYIGRLDKNGVKIFDGDILRDNELTLNVKWDNTNCIFSVEGIYKGGKCNGMVAQYNLGTMQIIDNVFDNPELLGGNNNEI